MKRKKTPRKIVKSRSATPRENVEIVMLRAENEQLRKNLEIFEELYSIPKTKLIKLIKMGHAI